MESVNLHDLGMFIESEIYIIQSEMSNLVSKHSSQNNHLKLNEEIEDDLSEELDLIYEGNFEKGILVIYEASHLEPDLREFLFNILGAVKCSLKDVALSSAESIEEVTVQKIEELAPNKIIVFGKLNHPIFHLKQVNYEIRNEDGVEYLFADDLRSISMNIDLKKSLWAKLQVLFEVSR
ncbi:hypothetical protein Belba_2645 [Belliella baltica DSM 15883]|uniref:Uncharacterized protein n=1 Tax=Belliella baltica (strain DSM 15883 / CIP 108006 / LMG 21964 / BA134) TaxID=866536 RepID=I3Z7H2_BELBD|nr:hypothetical protein [Belliella baltica]AFL85190.1 hypothetical protein Belba_2645 [Belliella baltica DSM 15883]